MARLVAAGAVDSANVPSLQLNAIQACRVAFSRWPLRNVCSPTGSLHVLLAAVLLVFLAGRAMIDPQHDSGTTSNDLLESLIANHVPAEHNYQIVAQSAEDLQNIENSPAVSMGPYLLRSGQTRLLTTISIYSLRGATREQVRLLYMNAPAIQVWEEMGRAPKIIGTQHRPPRVALLTFGVPFSE